MFVTREQLEQQEAERYAVYATLSMNSQGRTYPQKEPHYRTAFQRDRDRVVHSAAFRRLEYKTQVFVNDAGDYYRTRLTHTLEVTQIGRTLARALALNEDLVEVICLAHDLGHAPFGHAGEVVLNKLLKDHGGFNHNFQSYRVVTKLEKRYPDWDGLNLTHETLEGIAKHESEYDLSKDVGFDTQIRGSIEAQVANVTDELAYNAHDLDDGLQSGLITPDMLKDLEIWQALCDRLGWKGSGPMDEEMQHRFIREQIGMQIDDVIEQSSKNLQLLNPQSPEDIQRHSAQVMGHSERFVKLNRELKDFLYRNMYQHYTVMHMSKRAERFITGIFESFIEEPLLMPHKYQELAKKKPIHRVVADYISSMTDRSAILEYRRLYDPLTRPQ